MLSAAVKLVPANAGHEGFLLACDTELREGRELLRRIAQRQQPETSVDPEDESPPSNDSPAVPGVVPDPEKGEDAGPSVEVTIRVGEKYTTWTVDADGEQWAGGNGSTASAIESAFHFVGVHLASPAPIRLVDMEVRAMLESDPPSPSNLSQETDNE